MYKNILLYENEITNYYAKEIRTDAIIYGINLFE